MATGTYGIAAWKDLSSTIFTRPSDTNLCPTKSDLTSRVSSSYTLAISGSYASNQLVKYSNITTTKKAGKLTINLSNGTPHTDINDNNNLVKYSTNTSYTPSSLSDLESLSSLLTALIDSYTSTSITISCSQWDAYSSNMRVFYCWDINNSDICYIYGSVTSSQLTSLKNGTDVTISGSWASIMSY